MAELDYDKLLERGYSQIPEKTTSGERFEMPVIDSIIEGNKTIIRNFEFIANKLRRDPQMVAKFFTKELAVPSSLEGPRLVLSARFADRVLSERLKLFVDMYVLCKECKKPDTNIRDSPHGGKMLVCEACGARAPVKG
ncbi:Translation initiation factor 2 subunit beta [uncultured archaeon]|nr:Translation initiation factor 2 subunit beta [uncultured archaeon]